MNPEVLLGLINNVALLLALGVLYDTMALRSRRPKLLHQIAVGIIIGAVAAAVMLSPFKWVPGIIFDTRSVALCIAGLFFGWIPTVIAALCAAILRIYQGGGGAVMGVSVIAASSAIGLLWRHARGLKYSRQTIHWVELYLLGLVVHAVMLLLMFTLPRTATKEALLKIAPSVMLLYPIATVLLGLLLSHHRQRRHAEELVEQEKRRFSKMLERGGDIVTLISPQGFVHYVGDSVTSILGWPLTKILGKSLKTMVHPDDWDAFANVLIDLIKDPCRIQVTEFRLQHKDASWKWMAATLTHLIEDPDVGAIVLNCRDITEQKRSEKALRESEERYRRIVQTANEGIWAMDQNMNITFVNQKMAQMLGYSIEEMLGKPVSMFMFTEDLPEHQSQMDNRQKGLSNQYERRFRSADGGERWMMVSARVLQNVNGQFAGSFAMFTDITDRKRIEEKIRTLNAELEQRVVNRTAQLQVANQELEAFAYSVSHDLRGPLRAIDGFSHILAQDYSEHFDEEGHRLLNVVRGNAQKMDQLISDLLTLSRITRAEMRFVPIDMTSLAQEVYQELAPKEPQRQFAFELTPLPVAIGDSNLIRQVWVNLLSNAIKYSAKSSIRRIEVSARREADAVIYTVKDSGAGFNPNYADKLFRPFQRLHNSEEFEGTGVGLAIVHRIINRHGGKVWAEGQINQGAAFYFSLPLYRQDRV